MHAWLVLLGARYRHLSKRGYRCCVDQHTPCGVRMFHQLLAPVALSLPLSFVVAALPIVTVLVLLGVIRTPAWLASLAGLLVALVLAMLVWQLPPLMALSATSAGCVFGLWPVMWIVVNALLLYNLCIVTGRFDAFRDWVLEHL